MCPLATHARQVRVVATVNENTIGTEETVTYSIEIRGAPANTIQTPSPPEAEGLNLVRSIPSTQSNVSIINGVMEQSYIYRWSYLPLQEGSTRIGSATVTVAGESFQTDPILVTIVPQAQRPTRRAGQGGRQLDPFSALLRSPFDTAAPDEEPAPDSRDLFIRAIASSRSVVQNQQVTIEYQLFFREGIQLRQSRLTDSWDAEGFWREELAVETRPIPQIVVENGLRYNKIVLKRAAVFPTRTGSLVVDSLRIESEAVLPNRSSDPFQQLFSLQNRFRPVELASPSVVIESKPLPSERPTSFTGAVGNFRLAVEVDRTNLEVGSSLQVIARVSGTGNLATLVLPAFVPPAAFELYDPRVETNLDRAGRRLAGTKTFTYVMVPRSNGTFELPGIEFSHFEPSSGEFVTQTTNPVSVMVTGSASTPATVVATTNGLPVDDVAPSIESAGRWIPVSSAPVHTKTWPYATLLVPLVVLGFAWIYSRHQDKLVADVGYARHRRAHPLAKKHLNQAKILLDNTDKAAFFGEVERAVLGFIGNRLNISEKGLTRPQLDRALRNSGVEDNIRTRLQSLLESCDGGRFAPGSVEPSDMKVAYDEAAALIVLADSAIGNTS